MMFREKLYKVNQKWIWKIDVIFTSRSKLEKRSFFVYYGNRVNMQCYCIWVNFGFGLIKFSFSKAGLVFFLITGIANVIFLSPKLFTIWSCRKKLKLSKIYLTVSDKCPKFYSENKPSFLSFTKFFSADTLRAEHSV